MTVNALRKKVIDYVNHAEPNVLEAVYKVLQVIEGDDSSSLMNASQKTEVERRSALMKAGQLKIKTWEEVKNKTRLGK
jgi:hypothetical protein